MRFAFAIAAVLAFSLSLPAAEIKAPTQAQPHTLVRASTVAPGTGYAWFVLGPEGFADSQTYDGGKAVAFTGKPGRYAIVLVVSEASGKLDQGQAIVQIGEVTPVPLPPDVPPVVPPVVPPTTVTLPDGRYKFSKAVYNEANKIPLPARIRAAALADNYASTAQSLAAQIAAGVTPTTADIQAALATLKEKNRASLGTDLAAWSAWGAALTAKFNGHNADGTLRSGSDYVDAFSEIYVGLKAITSPPPPAPTKPTAVTYVFEKDDGGVPSPVSAALDKLNRKGILATAFEEDTVDGEGATPEQYKIPLKAAQEAGLPALVATSGAMVMRVVKAPKNEAEVLELAP